MRGMGRGRWVWLSFSPGWNTLVCTCGHIHISLYACVHKYKCKCVRLLQHQPLVSRSLRLGRLSLQTQVLQCIVEVFVNLLRLLAGLQVREILTDLLDQLIQDLDRHLKSNTHRLSKSRLLWIYTNKSDKETK